LRKYNDIPHKNFFLLLEERERRFNYGTPKQQHAARRARLDL
jgi:transposase